MRRTWPILMATAALLMGCSSGDSTPTTVTVTESPSTPTPEEGDQDAPTEASLFSQQFHPCEAFTEEQLQKAGLGKHLEMADRSGERIQSCGFSSGDPEKSGTFLVATDVIDRPHVQELDLDPADWESEEVHGIYVHKMATTFRECNAAVDFEWGRLAVDYKESGDGWDRESLCSAPARILESLIIQAGGINGT